MALCYKSTKDIVNGLTHGGLQCGWKMQQILNVNGPQHYPAHMLNGSGLDRKFGIRVKRILK